MAKVKLTAGRIAGFQCDEGNAQSFLWCDAVPGLGVRATAGLTAKRYIFQAKVKGRSMRVTIGKVSAWSIGEAQAEARRLQILIDQGSDPRQVKADDESAKEAARRAKEAEATVLHLKELHESVPATTVWVTVWGAFRAELVLWIVDARHGVRRGRLLSIGPLVRHESATSAQDDNGTYRV